MKDEFDLRWFCQAMREQNLIPIALQGATPFLEALAIGEGLAILNQSTVTNKSEFDFDSKKISKSTKQTSHKFLNTPIRSGQQAVCQDGDLIITAAVSHGAELLAKGNIHVYGPLRGRALAGISGNRHARIFCQSLEAELVSIAGFYRLSDAIEKINSPCQIYLKDEHIHIEPI